LRRAGGGAGIVAVGLGGGTVLHHAHAQQAGSDAADAMPGHEGASRAQTAAAPSQAKQRPDEQYAFFDDEQADVVAAIAERLWPGAPGKPGARDADVLNYIDLALAGAYRDQQDFYRRGLQALQAYAAGTYGQPFERLTPDQQDDVLRAVESGDATGFTWPTPQAFFNTLWTHTIEGMFADPAYGGNRDFAGWRLIEFPGAQQRYLRSDMQTDAKFTRAPIIGLKEQYEERIGQPVGGE
jgi:hypothetical protein